MGSLTGNLNFSSATEQNPTNSDNHFSVNAVTRFCVAAGYNSSTWDVTANWIQGNLPFKGYGNYTYAFQTGNYRFIISKKIASGERLRKRLKPLNKFLKNNFFTVKLFVLQKKLQLA